ncbi:Pre-mRNA-splicing factor ATP-dependent RNA helicase PRP16, partial [Coemansia nantahalensis]
YMQCVTAVDPRWLAEMGPMFFSIRAVGASGKQHTERHIAQMASEFERAKENAARSEAARARALQRPSQTGTVTIGAPRFKAPRRRTNL